MPCRTLASIWVHDETVRIKSKAIPLFGEEITVRQRPLSSRHVHYFALICASTFCCVFVRSFLFDHMKSVVVFLMLPSKLWNLKTFFFLFTNEYTISDKQNKTKVNDSF
jgi:hypothetical protein